MELQSATRNPTPPCADSHRSTRETPRAHTEENGSLPLAAAATIHVSRLRLVLTILLPSAVNFFSSFTNAIITVGLPIIAHSLALPRSLYLWPSSIYGLTAGAMLLIAGATADIIGARRVELAGIFCLGVFTLACGLSATGIQLVVFRGVQGVASAMHLPASVAMVTTAVPPGRARNIGFACLGLSQPLGFSVGLVISGVMIERAGWRSGFYLCSAATLVIAMIAIRGLPQSNAEHQGMGLMLNKMAHEIDWVGGLIASGGLTMLSYVLAVLSADLSSVRSATTATVLALSVTLLLAFPGWMHYRERTGKPALIPNSLWKNLPFTSTCIMLALSYGALTSMELFSSLYFQEVQDKSVTTTSLYVLPSLVVGVIINVAVGMFVDRIPARWLVVVSSLICSLAPSMMALVNPAWPYWYLEVWAQIFAPFSVDVLFTVGLIIVSASFPEKTQALAGAVFNTVSQFGMSLVTGLCQVVALAVMDKGDGGENSGHNDAFEGSDKGLLLEGYRAGFWTMFACMVLCTALGIPGLRAAGKVGIKRE